MPIGDDLIETIVQRILHVAQPVRIILFGSAATGRMTRDSDIDLLVIERTVRDPRAESVRIRAALGALGCPVDVVVMTNERFEQTKDVIGGIAYPASKYGRLIYEAA